MQTSLETTTTSSSPIVPIKWDYKCIFCSKTFNSGRALGGHQNAHRFEPREGKRTHHVRVPRHEYPSRVPPPPPLNLWPPQIAMNPSQNPCLRPPNPRNGPWVQPGLMATARVDGNFYQAYPIVVEGGLPPRVEDHRHREWDMLVARVGQGVESEISRIEPDLNARDADHGVEQVDLELKL